MADVVIRAEGIGKKYVIGHQAERERYVALRDVLASGAKRIWRKTADMMKGRNLVPGGMTEEFWALRDVSFEVKRGEVLGIIGRNGAGKSTLLKILSRITEPSEGRVSIKGRVASLLEVGTGFHPELTGRENIYLNGAILGMTRAEIRRKFDEIVAFAEVEKFLDTPVKRYSSGMYVRLAFAVAAHLEPEILVIDEVLAVGDAEFQKKCLGKMSEVAGGGRTVLFVSHNMAAVRTLCTRGILLENGAIRYAGDKIGCLNAYVSVESLPVRRPGISFTKVAPHFHELYLDKAEYEYGDTLVLNVVLNSPIAASVAIEAEVHDSNGASIAYTSSAPMFGKSFMLAANEKKKVTLEIGPLPLAAGGYSLHLWLIKPWTETYHVLSNAVNFRVVHSDPGNSGFDFRQDYGRGAIAIPVFAHD